MMTVLSSIAASVCLLGIWLNSRKDIRCWPVWIAGGLLWCLVAAMGSQWALLLLNLLYIPFEVQVWRAWRRDSMVKRSRCCRASMRIAGRTTQYYVCIQCGKPCDPA
jgi:nicotinamide riboside transporter PnuC